ncbi:helix-turn-helix transcriptional regulator [Flavobacterium litorale]|uniref:Helix-turn-helix domain-containing protein n=1 Tax=Flavobacterium litorale TaxID=2856519 RepID=A0ABX8VD71_9FLAO|nr:helix-turn-helix domain-containing protein [Flavobacterium litorale]QYJ68785.1 helix-turn-helix domain-containing protein [Flavobacterium litorale]
MEFIQQQLKEITALLKKQNLLEKEFFTLEEAALYLGQSKSSIYKLTSKKEIPFYVPGGKMIYFRKPELDAWIIDSKVETVDELELSIDQYLSQKA